jgi:YihY family inner membrane protein
MNPVEWVARRADAAQQRRAPLAFVVGVIKKFGDDNGGVLVANLAYSAFVSVFPLLLILVTVLIQLAARDPALRQQVVNAAVHQFPLARSQLSDIRALRRSTLTGLVVGLLLLLWGVTRLGQAGLFTMEQVWNLPGPARPGYLPRLARAVLFLCVLGAGVAASTLLASLAAFAHNSAALPVLAAVLAAAANVGLYLLSFRVLTPRGVPARALVLGAVAGGIAWTLVLALGAYLAGHFLHSDSVYGVFATVLGLLAWIYLGVEITVYAAEVNVVLARHLWPRAIVQPPLQEADRSSLALQALQNQRRPEQQVEVWFTDRPASAPAPVGTRTPQRPGDITPPGRDGGPSG